VTTTESPVSLAGRADARPAGPRPSSSQKARNRRKWYEIIGLSAPAALAFGIFVLAPVGFAVYYSLYKWNGYGWPTAEDFKGLDNYIGPYGALKDHIFLSSLRNNLLIVVGSLVVQGPLAVGLALLLNRRFRGRAMFRLLIFVPYVVSEATVGIMWRLILNRDSAGDALLHKLGLGSLIRSWLGDPHVVIWTMLFILTWKYTGFALILFLAGLANVPAELSEAAAIDGASWWETQRHITIPLLGPTIRLWAFLSMIGSLQVFDVIWVASTPAMRSLGASSSMATYLVDSGFNSRQWGYGNAVAVILFTIAFAAALLVQRFLLRRDLDGSLTRGVN